MRFEHFQQILEIQKNHSLASAAAVLSMKQSSLTTSLKQLEEELGYTIFERFQHKCIPTVNGKVALSLAQEILNDLNEINTLANNHQRVSGVLRIGIHPLLANTLIPGLTMHFYDSFPNVQLINKETSDLLAIDQIVDGVLNLMVTSLFAHQKHTITQLYDTFNIQVEELTPQSTLCVFLGHAHPLASKEHLGLDEIQDFPILYYKHGFYNKRLTLPSLSSSQLIEDRETLKNLLMKHHAITILPDFFAFHDPYVVHGQIKAIPLEENTLCPSIALLYSKDRALNTLELHAIKQMKRLLSN